MATSRRNEDRVLDKSEKDLVDQTRHPALGDLSDKDLTKLVKLLRDRRDRARDIARTQRRNVRGKGAAEAKEGAERGNKEKMSLLAQALQRANKESKRRDGLDVQADA
ncbi:hypothetical protein [Pelagibacterium luteolum]|uniref:Uncharacterized protein n=1 Tax=Pelagibacterium luteolum TaxID=440168 RepID=A0A1G7TSF4_9HYPH|nr:hypothetical protein [Pelagibacterium luteolum]SDG37589.1 hypothetical protein SAMN04487974_102282 [Pelagibacterium luteolum]